MDDLQRLLQHLDDIEEVLRKHDYPGVNQAALSRIENLVSQMRGVDSYISLKAGRLKELAGKFYSARRYLKEPGGAAGLHAEMLHDLPSRMRGQVEHLAGLRSKPY